MRACAARWYVALDVESGPVTPQRSPLADAVEALMLMARAWRLRFGAEPLGAWERAQWLTGGVLSALPLPPQPPSSLDVVVPGMT